MDHYLKTKLTYIKNGAEKEEEEREKSSAYVNRFKTWYGQGFNKKSRASLNLKISMVASTVINASGLIDSSRTAKWQDGDVHTTLRAETGSTFEYNGPIDNPAIMATFFLSVDNKVVLDRYTP